MQELAAYCGRNYSEMQVLLLKFLAYVDLLLAAAIRALQLVSCKTIVSLYVDTVYYGMCTYSPEAVYWVFVVSIGTGP